MDAHKNFAYSAVATAPSPASSGLTLVVTAGQGAKFPATPFNAVVWAASAIPITTNSEIIRVTGISTDTLTFLRQQEGSASRSILVGDQIAAAITDKALDEPSAKSAPAADVSVPSDLTLFVGDELDCGTNNVEVAVEGEVLVL